MADRAGTTSPPTPPLHPTERAKPLEDRGHPYLEAKGIKGVPAMRLLCTIPKPSRKRS